MNQPTRPASLIALSERDVVIICESRGILISMYENSRYL